jgi:hypothetical protein
LAQRQFRVSTDAVPDHNNDRNEVGVIWLEISRRRSSFCQQIRYEHAEIAAREEITINSGCRGGGTIRFTVADQET